MFIGIVEGCVALSLLGSGDIGVEDAIVKARFLLGVVYGFVSYLIYRAGIVLYADVSTTIWLIAGIIYVGSIVYVEKKYLTGSVFLNVFRGLISFYATWLIILLVLYDVAG